MATKVKMERRTQGERREEAERRILEAGTRLLAEQGLDQFTLAEVGVAAGYSRGLPAHYFGSKRNFEARLAAHVVQKFRQVVQDHGESHGLFGLVEVIQSYFDAAINDPNGLCVLHIILSEAVSNPELSPQMAKLSARTVRSFEHYIQQGIDAGDIRPSVDPKLQGLIILAGLRGIVAQWLIDRSVNLEGVALQLVDTLLNGLATPQALERHSRTTAKN